MSQPVHINRRRALAPDELTRKYLHARDAVNPDELEDPFGDGDYADYDDYDDFWDPQRGRTADDYLVLAALEESIGFACKKPKLGALLPASLRRLRSSEPVSSKRREARPSFPQEELADALFEHVQLVVSRARLLQFTYSSELQAALLRNNGGLRGVESALRRFERRPGPIVMSLLFTPFWVRPLASFCPPEGDDAAVTTSLISHLFQIYPVPKPLHQPWLAEGLPSLKWVSWLLLLGQGGNLHRASRRFGWSIAKRFTHHFSAAPGNLTIMEACMWAEIARRGGDRLDFDRIRRDPAFAIDPTEGPEQPEAGEASNDWERQQRENNEATRSFWQQTVEWLIRWRADLDDESCAMILEWAMHLHTEALQTWRVPHVPFTWSGREPAGARAAALEYRRQRDMPYGDLTWTSHGLDWDLHEGEAIAWTVRELTTSRQLGEESRAMHHCVASYAHRCAQGFTAIFSLCASGARKVTVELDPFQRRVVQARGACNRAATHEEQTVIARWLAATAPDKADAAAR